MSARVIFFKRIVDVFISITVLLIAAPILILVALIVWLQDFHSPFYIPFRVGLNGEEFRMFKLRSMVVDADRTGVDSTGSNDKRITKVGSFIRAYKLDELTQMWNVLNGSMSLVGPRPNIKRETNLYTNEEMKLLNVRPGITDFASIVFSDEGEILRNEVDPDIAYHQLIRPGKSELGIFYINNSSLIIDFAIILLTAISIVSKATALKGVVGILRKNGASPDLIELASRKSKLIPKPPPGSKHIVTSRVAE